jgi:hypothetical protein
MQGRGAAVVRTAGLFLIITASVKCESFETTNCVSVRVSPRKNRYGSQDSEVLFLHVGKAGGGSVWHWMQHNGLASQINVKHPNYELTQQDAEQYKHIIINVREPVARANSALKWHANSMRWGRVPKTTPESLLYNSTFSGVNETDPDWVADGVTSRIAEALDAEAPAELREAAMVVAEGVRHMLPMSRHCNMGVLTYLTLKKDPVHFYTIPIFDGDDMNEEIRFQLERVVKAAGLTIKLKPTHPEKPNAIILKELEAPPYSKGATHSSKAYGKLLSDHELLSPRASRNLQRMYATDYTIIGMLGIHGCGGLASCMHATQEIAGTLLS